jgi:hypothetical protein
MTVVNSVAVLNRRAGVWRRKSWRSASAARGEDNGCGTLIFAWMRSSLRAEWSQIACRGPDVGLLTAKDAAKDRRRSWRSLGVLGGFRSCSIRRNN